VHGTELLLELEKLLELGELLLELEKLLELGELLLELDTLLGLGELLLEGILALLIELLLDVLDSKLLLDDISLDSDELDGPLVVEEELLADGIDWPLELYEDEPELGPLLVELLLDEGIPGFSP
jgi:hypothetical protein